MINKEPNKIALLGAGCSSVSERLAEMAKTWNLLMVSTLTLNKGQSQWHGTTNFSHEIRDDRQWFKRTDARIVSATDKVAVGKIQLFRCSISMISRWLNSPTLSGTSLRKALGTRLGWILRGEVFINPVYVSVHDNAKKQIDANYTPSKKDKRGQ